MALLTLEEIVFRIARVFAAVNSLATSLPVLVTDAGASPLTEIAYVTDRATAFPSSCARKRRCSNTGEKSMSTYLAETLVRFAMPWPTANFASQLFTKLATFETTN